MLNYFLLFAAVFANFYHIYGYNEPRIMNGEITPSNLFRFTFKVPGCTATVISYRHALTAAHCYKYQLVQASFNKKNNGKTYMFTDVERDGIEKFYFPLTSTDHLMEQHDIAILEFPEGKNLTKLIEPVKLAKDYIEKDGDEAYIAGFGSWWQNDGRLSGDSFRLRHAKVSMNNFCFGTLKICGGNKTHQSLPGDSGGPMVIYRNNQWYEIGVCQGGISYDIRTRVSSYCNFIEEVTNGEAKCESIYPENYFNGQMLPIKHFEPIYQGQSTPLKLFNFVVPLYNYYYNQGCTATVISKRYLLTAAFCVYKYSRGKENKKVQMTQNSSYRTITGKLFPDFRSKSVQPHLKNDPIDDVTAYFPLNYKWPWKQNFAVIEFPNGTDFGVEPVTLAKDYFEIFMEEIIIAGYGKYDLKGDMHINGTSPALQHSNTTFGLGSKIYLENNENLMKDEGGPTLIDRNGKFYQIGVNFYEGTPNGSRTFLLSHCDFIEEVTKNEVKCESILPIYEKPFSSESTTTTMQTMILPSNEIMPSAAALINTQKPSNISPKMNQFQIGLFLIALLFMLLMEIDLNLFSLA